MRNIFSIFCFCIFISACRKSTFVADPNDTLVPQYSESGRNIAGALMNDTAWRCEMHPCFTCIVWRFYINSSLTGDSTLFKFEGAYTSNSIIYNDTSSKNVGADFSFVVKGLKLETQESLLKLNNKTFQLDGINNYSSIFLFSQYPNYNKGIGTLTINKVQKGNWEFGDGSINNPKIYKFIVSGHFNFNTTADRLYIVKDGRFDMEVYLNSNFRISN